MPSKKKSKTKQAKLKARTQNRTLSRKGTRKARAGKKSLKRRARTRTGSVNAARDIQREIRTRQRTTAEMGSGRQSDFEGLSRMQEADFESVDELVEEGNIFEAGAVAGVEEADNSDEREVQTHEVPEDDVPDEYLDKD